MNLNWGSVLSSVAIDSREYIRGTHGSVYKACLGVAITINDEKKFVGKYNLTVGGLLKKYGIKRKKTVYKSYDIMSNLKPNHYKEFFDDFYQSLIIDQISELDVFYSLFFKKDTPEIRIYGRDESGIEKMGIIPFIDKLNPSYPHVCAWRYLEQHKKFNGALHLDHFTGSITEAWETIDGKDNIFIYFMGDCCNPLIATADLVVRYIDIQLRYKQRRLYPEYIAEVLPGYEGKLSTHFLGQKFLSNIRPISKTPINPTSKIKHPIIFIVKEKPKVLEKRGCYYPSPPSGTKSAIKHVRLTGV